MIMNLFAPKKQSFIALKENICLRASVSKTTVNKVPQIIISNLEEFPNTPFKTKGFFDPTILKALKGEKNAICTLYPNTRFVYRLKTDKMIKTHGFASIPRILKDRFNIDANTNRIAVLDAVTGLEIGQNDPLPDEICFFGAEEKELTAIQNELKDANCNFRKIWLTTLVNTSGILNYCKLKSITSPIVCVDFSSHRSLVYVINNQHIEAAYPPIYGLDNLITLTRKECNFPDDTTAFKYLLQEISTDEKTQQAVLQRMTTDIKSYIDFFEVQTSCPIEYFFIYGLNSELNWVSPLLAQKTGLKVLEIDYENWLKSNNIFLKNNKDIQKFSNNQWFGMLSAFLINYK